MLVVEIKIWPGGNKKKERMLGRMILTNDGTGTKTRGNYRVQLLGWNGTRVWKSGVVKDFPRRTLREFDLVFRALKNIVGERNGVNDDRNPDIELEDDS